MRISQLIAYLNEYQIQHGDLEVVVHNTEWDSYDAVSSEFIGVRKLSTDRTNAVPSPTFYDPSRIPYKNRTPPRLVLTIDS